MALRLQYRLNSRKLAGLGKVNPKVSVITSVLNGAATIETCLRSVKTQDYDNIEHIVVDGASTDGTLEILQGFSADVVSEPDAGIYDAFNKGIGRASGEIIHFLNSDDRYRKEDVISRMVRFMGRHQLDLAHARVEQHDAKGLLVRTIGEDVSFGRLLRKCRVAQPSVFTRREVFKKFGGFSTGFEIAGDHEYFLRIWKHVKTGFVPEVMAVMLLGGRSNSQVSKSYRESMAAAIIHGMPPGLAWCNYHYEVLKAGLLRLKFK